MDLERKSVDEEDKNDKVSDEVADRQLDSEDNRDEGGIMLRKSQVEIQSGLKTEKPGLLREKNSEFAQGTGEEISNAVRTEEGHIINTPLHDLPPLEHVTESSAVNGSVPKSADVIEVGSVADKSNEKGTDDLQNSGDKTEVENMDVQFLQTVNQPERAQANNKGDEKTVCSETKDVESENQVESIKENKVDSIKPGSTKGTVKSPSTKQVEWNDWNVLLIRGLAPPQCGDLKQLLNTTLGSGSHRIEPRNEGDSAIRVRFRSKDEMDVARDILHKQIYLGCKLTAVNKMQVKNRCGAAKKRARKIRQLKALTGATAGGEPQTTSGEPLKLQGPSTSVTKGEGAASVEPKSPENKIQRPIKPPVKLGTAKRKPKIREERKK